MAEKKQFTYGPKRKLKKTLAQTQREKEAGSINLGTATHETGGTAGAFKRYEGPGGATGTSESNYYERRNYQRATQDRYGRPVNNGATGLNRKRRRDGPYDSAPGGGWIDEEARGEVRVPGGSSNSRGPRKGKRWTQRI
jgi:hypothetical protein